MFARSDHGYAVLTHQPAHPAVADIQANFFQLFCHSWPAIAAKAETRLFLNMRKRDQIRSLSAAGGTAAECPQTARTHIHHATHAFDRKRKSVFFDKLKPHGFWLEKNTVAFLRNSDVSLTWQFL